MGIRIELTGAEFARVRFAISPVYETVMAISTLRQPGAHAVNLPWASWARPRLAGIDDLALLRALTSGHGKPAFLMPPPDAQLPDLETELRRVRAAPADRVRKDLEFLGRSSGVTREVSEDPRAYLPRIVAALRQVYEALLAPHWGRILRLLDADITYRARVLADGGAQALFADLHREVAWAEGELVVYPRRPEPLVVHLTGHGLVLCPSVFAWPRVTANIRPVTAGTLRYPARGLATLWETGEASPDAMAALLGRTRASLLAALAEPTTTSELARRVKLTAGAVSQHLGVLRAAGLVVTRRDGRTVLHLRSARADSLLAAP